MASEEENEVENEQSEEEVDESAEEAEVTKEEAEQSEEEVEDEQEAEEEAEESADEEESAEEEVEAQAEVTKEESEQSEEEVEAQAEQSEEEVEALAETDNEVRQLRQQGKAILGLVSKNEKNITVIEQKLYELSQTAPSFSQTYRWFIYQYYGDILNKKPTKTIQNQLNNSQVGWDHPVYSESKKKIDEFDGYLEQPFEIVEGALKCDKCGSRRTFSMQKQTRSLDESSTSFCTCAECGHKWVYSG